MKITKKSFIENMEQNASIFCGITKRLYSKDEVYCAIRDAFQPDFLLNYRKCKAYSKGLKFTDESILFFNQNGKYEFYKYTYAEGIIYICCHNYYDDFDDITRTKAMYYLIKE